MIIGGFQKISLIDYPGKISAVIFTQGCTFRCPFCHNPELVLPQYYKTPLDEESIFAFLRKRQGKLDAVCITGGEPSLQEDIVEFIDKVKELGYAVKLDTTGIRTDILLKALESNLVDYVAMDIKAPLEKYDDVVQRSVDKENIKESIFLIMNKAPEYEFRTTVVKSMLSVEDILSIARSLIFGAEKYYLQQFFISKHIEPYAKNMEPYTKKELEQIREMIVANNYVAQCLLRA